jgi:hypothetical protein
LLPSGQQARTIWIADAHRDGKRFIVRADEKLTAFVELEAVALFAVGFIEKIARADMVYRTTPDRLKSYRPAAEIFLKLGAVKRI